LPVRSPAVCSVPERTHHDCQSVTRWRNFERSDIRSQKPQPGPKANLAQSTSIGAGSPAFTLTLNGNNFVESSSVVRWNGQDLDHVLFIDQLTAQVPINNISTPGAATINVFNPTPGWRQLKPAWFTIDPSANPVPQIDSLSPMIISTGSQSMLTVNGSKFVPASIVRVNDPIGLQPLSRQPN
jgi:hypothetical protein